MRPSNDSEKKGAPNAAFKAGLCFTVETTSRDFVMYVRLLLYFVSPRVLEKNGLPCLPLHPREVDGELSHSAILLLCFARCLARRCHFHPLG